MEWLVWRYQVMGYINGEYGELYDTGTYKDAMAYIDAHSASTSIVPMHIVQYQTWSGGTAQ